MEFDVFAEDLAKFEYDAGFAKGAETRVFGADFIGTGDEVGERELAVRPDLISRVWLESVLRMRMDTSGTTASAVSATEPVTVAVAFWASSLAPNTRQSSNGRRYDKERPPVRTILSIICEAGIDFDSGMSGEALGATDGHRFPQIGFDQIALGEK